MKSAGDYVALHCAALFCASPDESCSDKHQLRHFDERIFRHEFRQTAFQSISIAAGEFSSYESACREMVKIGQTHEPDNSLAEVYRRKYQRFRQLLDVLAPAWEPLGW